MSKQKSLVVHLRATTERQIFCLNHFVHIQLTCFPIVYIFHLWTNTLHPSAPAPVLNSSAHRGPPVKECFLFKCRAVLCIIVTSAHHVFILFIFYLRLQRRKFNLPIRIRPFSIIQQPLVKSLGFVGIPNKAAWSPNLAAESVPSVTSQRTGSGEAAGDCLFIYF